MRLSVACNFDPELINQIKENRFPVDEIFGKLPEDFMGGGRSSYMLSPLTKKGFIDYVELAKANNINFCYLLNAPCFNNQEFTRSGQKKINRMLSWLNDIGIKSITVSSPFLLQMIKKRYPGFKVRVSVFACVDNPLKAKRWEELGADCITLDSILVNRDFETLQKIRDVSKIDLQLMVNNSCLLSCPMCHYHNTTLGHSSQSNHKNKGFILDVCILRCSYLKLLDPVNYLRCEWIRPEDLRLYENMGYSNFKIIERSTPTEYLVKRMKAYVDRRYDGNLLDLVQPYGYDTSKDDSVLYQQPISWVAKFLFKPWLINPIKLLKVKALAEKRGMLKPYPGEPPVYLDNRKLDGFIDTFVKKSCRYKNCDECQHCHRAAERALTIKPEFKKSCLDMYENVFDLIHSGDLWDQKVRATA